jgi:uncharacterized protein YndB with AHSA1/START domain
MTTTLNHDILIHAPVEDVWRVLADLEAVQHYNPMVSTARYVSERRSGVGATRLCEFKPGGSVKERVTEWTPNQAMAMEAFDHPSTIRGRCATSGGDTSSRPRATQPE